MKKSILIFVSLFVFQFAYSQADSTKTKIYRNDALAVRLDSAAEKVTIEEASYFLKCTFSHGKSFRGKKKPYYWNVFLKSSKANTIPPTFKMLKLYILTDTLIYEYSYLPIQFAWNKSVDLYPKPLTVIVEFLDTKTNKKYFVRAKGPFVTKH